MGIGTGQADGAQKSARRFGCGNQRKRSRAQAGASAGWHTGLGKYCELQRKGLLQSTPASLQARCGLYFSVPDTAFHVPSRAGTKLP